MGFTVQNPSSDQIHTVKAWGNSSDKPVLVTHGGLDNAGSFDRLIPLLSPSFYYICIDLPSHGRSSLLPGFVPIHAFDFIMVYKLILDYFNRGKYILIGHSMGAAIGQYFARLYPEYVEKIIGIDCIVLHNIEPCDFKKTSVKRFNAVIAINKNAMTNQRPSYTEEEAIEKIRKNRLCEDLTVDAARCITNRMLEPVGNGRYKLSIDPRMKAVFKPLQDFRYVRETMRLFPITCPYLIIIAKQSPLVITDMNSLLDLIKKWGKITSVFLDAGHDVHLIHPELIAPHINDFLLKLESNL